MKKVAYTTFVILLLVISNKAYSLMEPHNNYGGIGCNACHTFTAPLGPNATKAATNYGLCTQSGCHSINTQSFYLPFDDPSFSNFSTGAFHRFNMSTSNPARGAGGPVGAAFKAEIQNGQIVCSTCHNQHSSGNVYSPGPLAQAGRLHLSSPVKVNGTGTGTITYTTPSSKPLPFSYLVEIVDVGGGVGTAKYRVSYNGGATWAGWNGTNWVAYITGSNGRLTGAGQALDNAQPAANVQITFSGNFVVGDRWKFYIGYPFLRAYPDVGNNTTGRRFCRDCHSQRAQTHFVGGNQWDGKPKSHPVGVPLNSNIDPNRNPAGYDRKPLDVDGRKQGTYSTNPVVKIRNSTNDLLLFQGITSMQVFGNISSGDVQCMTCHAPHWTDSNSRTKDRR